MPGHIHRAFERACVIPSTADHIHPHHREHPTHAAFEVREGGGAVNDGATKLHPAGDVCAVKIRDRARFELAYLRATLG